MKSKALWLLAGLGIGAAVLVGILRPAATAPQRLADGSVLKIREVVYGKEIARTFQNGNALQRAMGKVMPARLASVLPWWVRSRLLPTGSSGLRLSGDGKTCIFIITDRRHLPVSGKLELNLVLVADVHGGTTNGTACFATLGSPEGQIQGWALENFPTDCKVLHVGFMALAGEGHTNEAARFTIRNPAYSRRSTQ